MSDIYEADLQDVAHLITLLKGKFNPQGRDAFIISGVLQVHNVHDYPVGTLTYEDEQFRFTPHADLS